MKVALVDPVNSTIFYNYCLIDELARQGCAVEFFTANFIYEEVFPPANITFCDTFFRYSNKIKMLAKYHKVRQMFRALEYPFNLITLIRSLVKGKANIIHFLWLINPTVEYLIIRLLRQKGFPIVYTAHNALPHESSARHVNQYKRIYNVVDHIICLTQSVKDELVNKFHVRKEKISVIAHGDFDFIINQVKSNQVFHADIFEKKSSNFTVTYFGQIRPYKGLEYFIKAIPYVIKKHPACEFLIAGKDSGGNKEYYLKMICEMNLDSYVSCDFRYIPLSDLITYLRQTDIVVLPYIASSQSGNIPMLSKMGIPVIATRVGGLPEMIEEGRNGFLVPPKDEKAIADAICKLLSNPPLLEKMKEDSVNYAKEAFSWNNIVKKTIEVYEKVAGVS
ncbi:MAG: glycosyltransferase family 4 protein [Planctomycetia bacterium]|uniref:glycosyltransferase family 4 protein n=1 Tax=Candidatus Kuenenia sp. TaxID=2499824 RepID=UPI001D4825EA|nr:glycosyltransferase family 4 protein [Planctomycetia bacterium]